MDIFCSGEDGLGLINVEHCGDGFKGLFVLFLISMCLTKWIGSLLVEMCLEFKVICGK